MEQEKKSKRHEDRNDLAGEHILGDLGQMVLFVIFLIVWIGDSFILNYTTAFAEFLPLYVRGPIAFVVLFGAVYFMRAGLQIIFDEIRPEPIVVRTGVFKMVRHPVYLGCLLFYLGLIISTLSILSVVVGIIIFLFYDFIAKYEEQLLRFKFGESYQKYMNEVPRWIPKLQILSLKNAFHFQN